MVANDLLQDAFERIKATVHEAVDGLDEAALSFQPTGSSNSIAWLVWHLTRIQDDHIAGLAGSTQLWNQGWRERFGLPFEPQATGYGQSAKEVAAVKAGPELLLGYYDAVHETTVQYVAGLHESDYGRVVDTRWDPPVTLAVRLVSVIADDLQHAGQAGYVRGLLPRQ